MSSSGKDPWDSLPEKVLADSAKCGADEAELHRLAEIGRRAESLLTPPVPDTDFLTYVYRTPGEYTAAAWAWFREQLLGPLPPGQPVRPPRVGNGGFIDG